MSKFIEPKPRNQITMFSSLDESIDKNNVVRIIDEIIDYMKLKNSDFYKNLETVLGRPKHNPILLLKLYIYCYFNGIRSSRKIEKECSRNIELMWLMGEIIPDHKCISDFRKNNGEAIKKTFKEFLIICDMMGLLGKELIAIDGSKVKASNSKSKCYTKNKLQEMLNYFEKRVIEYEKILNENDERESKLETLEINTSNIKSIKEKLEETKEKIKNVTNQKEKMEKENISQLTITDADSRLMKSSNKGFDVSFNAQIAVESVNHFIIATDVTNEVSDVEQLSLMSNESLKNLDIKESQTLTVVADKGYYSASEILKCKEDKRLDIIVAVPNSISHTKNPIYANENFIYDEIEDNYKCPEGIILINVSKPTSKEQVYKNATECQNCIHKSECTKAACREIIRNDKSAIKENAKKKLNENMETYNKRQSLAEHPFGTMKRSLGFTSFLTRGINKVKIENLLHVLSYNFKRLINILQTKGGVCQFQ